MAAGLPHSASLVSRFHITTLGRGEALHTGAHDRGGFGCHCPPAVIQSAQSGKEAVAGREGQGLHADLVQHEAAVQLFLVELPHNHVSLQAGRAGQRSHTQPATGRVSAP